MGRDATPGTAQADALSGVVNLALLQACVLGKSTALGERIPLQEAGHHIFGFMLMNDCSARDIQKWEYVPLGPFNGKNFVRPGRRNAAAVAVTPLLLP